MEASKFLLGAGASRALQAAVTAEEGTSVSASAASAAARAVAGRRLWVCKRWWGQIEKPSGGRSSSDSSCGGIKKEKEDAKRGRCYNAVGNNEDNDGIHARRVRKRARVGCKMRFLTCLLMCACRVLGDPCLREETGPIATSFFPLFSLVQPMVETLQLVHLSLATSSL